MKIQVFNPPANIDDFAGKPQVAAAWSAHVNEIFSQCADAVNQYLHIPKGQFYNPRTNGLADPDTLAGISWNGFPKALRAKQLGAPPNYALADKPAEAGTERPQDEYLEWYTVRNAQGRITSIQFTAEGYDYWQFLARHDFARVLHLYRTHINPQIKEAELRSADGSYNRLNKWNTRLGAMHLTHGANAIGAEIKLAADATVRRARNSIELTAAKPLIDCAQYGDGGRNSDPKIGEQVNALARQGAMITLADPVGLYIAGLDDAGWTLKNGAPAQGFWHIIRGTPGQILRAEYRPPANLVAQGFTVSDVRIAGKEIAWGGQVAEHITVQITGAACRFGTVNIPPVNNHCTPVPSPQAGGAGIMGAAPGEVIEFPTRAPKVSRP